jgi:hypothetical protein
MYGLDHLGGAKYGKLIIQEHPENWAAGFFTNVFGNALPIVQSLAFTGRCPRIRLHLDWQDNHDYSRRTQAIVKEARRCLPVIRQFPSIEWHISGACEHRLNAAQAQSLASEVLAAMPEYVTYVNTPMKGGALLQWTSRIINEIHLEYGTKPKGRYNFSYDGQPCTDYRDQTCQQIKDKYSDAETFYFWDARFNGNWEMGMKVPRPERKGWPDAKFIDSVIYLHRDMGSVTLPRKHLWKSHSENKGTGDPRAEKPVYICPVKHSEVILKCSNGQAAGRLRYYGTFTGGLFRYYASEWGYQIAEKARRIQGHSVCEVWIKGKKYGTVNPAFRSGKL